MKKTILLSLVILIAACKNSTEEKNEPTPTQKEENEIKTNYPQLLENVFEVHGGIKSWKEKRTLTFELPEKDAKELHAVDLWSRKDRVDSEVFSMGSDGKDVWLLDPSDSYQGDAAFYHNLMFYFYAMPFVLSDDGIVYRETADLEYGGKSYPGIRIGYQSGVGTSPKDEYFMHMDPDTGKMAWLGYTVTYRTGEVSDNVKWIRYDDWQSVDDLILPKSITWYNYEGPKILDARSKVAFENVHISKKAKPTEFYSKPENARLVEPKKHD
nr:DUF6503 family protein [Allomuricauda sp.]